METLKKHLPVSIPEGLTELHKIAVRFEEKIYTAATYQPGTFNLTLVRSRTESECLVMGWVNDMDI